MGIKEIFKQMSELDIQMKTRKRTHPSEVLQKEFIDEGVINIYELIFDMKIDVGYLTSFMEAKKPMTEEFAEKLSARLGTSKEFWLNLQSKFNNN